MQIMLLPRKMQETCGLSLQSSVRLSMVLMMAFALLGVTFNLAQVAADSSADPSPAGASPKRQYLIAPRIGRSASPQIWSALEEAALLMPGQLQAQRGFPGPLRSSLLFLVGNNRRIGPRSSGLLPQARIGRRAAPIGLMPQPRVGRRSGEDMSSQAADSATTQGSSADVTIERPAHRTTSFVPRLGKREQVASERMTRLLCAHFHLDCSPPMDGQDLVLENEQLEPEERFFQRIEPRQVRAESDLAEVPATFSASSKRVAFTPRIGR